MITLAYQPIFTQQCDARQLSVSLLNTRWRCCIPKFQTKMLAAALQIHATKLTFVYKHKQMSDLPPSLCLAEEAPCMVTKGRFSWSLKMSNETVSHRQSLAICVAFSSTLACRRPPMVDLIWETDSTTSPWTLTPRGNTTFPSCTLYSLGRESQRREEQ